MQQLSENLQNALNAIRIAEGSDQPGIRPRYIAIAVGHAEQALSRLMQIQGNDFKSIFDSPLLESPDRAQAIPAPTPGSYSFTNDSFLYRLRFWLIKKIAGKCIIVLNAKINLVKSDKIVELVGEVNGCFIGRNQFPCGQLFGENRCLSIEHRDN